MKKITKKVLREALQIIGVMEHDKKIEMICGMIGHSRIIVSGSCARCRHRIFEFDHSSMISAGFPGEDSVFHDEDGDKEKYEKMDWRDMLYVKSPFGIKKDIYESVESAYDRGLYLLIL